MSADERTWSEALGQLASRLNRYRACLVGGEVPEPYRLPAGLGPIPPELAPLGRELLAQQRQIAAALEARRARIGAELARRAGAGRPSRPPSFIDARA